MKIEKILEHPFKKCCILESDLSIYIYIYIYTYIYILMSHWLEPDYDQWQIRFSHGIQFYHLISTSIQNICDVR